MKYNESLEKAVLPRFQQAEHLLRQASESKADNRLLDEARSWHEMCQRACAIAAHADALSHAREVIAISTYAMYAQGDKDHETFLAMKSRLVEGMKAREQRLDETRAQIRSLAGLEWWYIAWSNMLLLKYDYPFEIQKWEQKQDFASGLYQLIRALDVLEIVDIYLDVARTRTATKICAFEAYEQQQQIASQKSLQRASQMAGLVDSQQVRNILNIAEKAFHKGDHCLSLAYCHEAMNLTTYLQLLQTPHTAEEGKSAMQEMQRAFQRAWQLGYEVPLAIMSADSGRVHLALGEELGPLPGHADLCEGISRMRNAQAIIHLFAPV